MKSSIKKTIGATLAFVATFRPTGTNETKMRRLFNGSIRPVPIPVIRGNHLGCGIAALIGLLYVAILGPLPLTAQTEDGPSADQRVLLLKQLGSDGKESTEKQILAQGEGMLITRLNGEIISKQLVQDGGGQRVIIKFREKSLVQQFSRGLLKANAQAARQQMEKSRENFRGRLLSLENQHRSSRGLAAVARQSLIAREYSYCFSGVAAQVHQDIMGEIRKMPEVESIYLDRQRSKCDGYGISQIGAPRVWQELGVTGTGVKIAIIDSGIDYTHPDLGGGIGAGFKVLGGYDFVHLDDDPMDDNGHGTHVAGIAAANGQIKGVAPGASLFAIKVLDNFGNGWDSNIIAGVEWAVANGANIINLSLGGAGNPDDPLSQAVDQATQAGILVVAAAGNSGAYNTVGSPAAARTALAVGADDNNEQMANFSSRGPAALTLQIKPEVVAPGVGIYSTVPHGGTQFSDPSGYAILNGTSMASPHVAGAAALLLQKNPQWTPEQLKLSLMERTLDLYQDVMTQGSGEVDVYASATTPLLSTGGELSLGWDDLRQSTFGSSQSLTLTNTTNSATQLSLTTQLNLPAGIQVAVTPALLSLQPGESKTVNFSLNVNNATTPNLPAQPFTYGGTVVATNSAGESIHRPFAFCKAPKLKVSFDDIVIFMGIFHGADNPLLQFPFGLGPVEMLLPAGSYDFYCEFFPFFDFPPIPRDVMREQVNIDSFTELLISKAEAKNRLEIKTIDQQGHPLIPDFDDFKSVIRHKGTSFALGNELAGFPVGSTNYCYVSDVGNAFTWDADVGGFANDPKTPTYIFHAALHNGINHSQTFEFKPADFNKTVMFHPGRPDHGQTKLRTWLWEIYLGDGGSAGSGYDSTPFAAPLERTIYSIVPKNPAAAGGFWSVDEVGLTNSGNLPFWFIDALYKASPFRPITRNVLAVYDRLGGEMFRSGAKRILLGQGPAYWSGSMHNQPDMIHLRTVHDSMLDQKFFNGQCQEELVHGLLPYTLSRQGQLIASGTLDEAMEYLLGRLKLDVVNMPVTPGAYELTIPFTGFFMHGKPGQLEVRNRFDTTKSDPNPPFLTGYQLLNPLDLLQQNPFLDAIPVTGAELRFGADDDVKVKEARLSFQQGNTWLPLPLLKVDAKHYAAYIPWLGFNRDSINLKLVVSDLSGNAVTMTETIPFLKK